MAKRKKNNAEAAAETTAPPVTADVYVVAVGKAITCKRGVISAGQRITASDLAGGVVDLRALADGGYVELT